MFQSESVGLPPLDRRRPHLLVLEFDYVRQRKGLTPSHRETRIGPAARAGFWRGRGWAIHPEGAMAPPSHPRGRVLNVRTWFPSRSVAVPTADESPSPIGSRTVSGGPRTPGGPTCTGPRAGTPGSPGSRP